MGVDLEHGKDDVTDQSGVGADPDIFSGRRAGWPPGKGAAYGTHLKHQEQMQEMLLQQRDEPDSACQTEEIRELQPWCGGRWAVEDLQCDLGPWS